MAFFLKLFVPDSAWDRMIFFKILILTIIKQHTLILPYVNGVQMAQLDQNENVAEIHDIPPWSIHCPWPFRIEESTNV